MTIYWRMRDIPELHAVRRSARRRLWREAVTRSLRVRHLLLALFIPMLAYIACALLVGLRWPAAHPWSWAIVGIPLGFIVNDCVVTQPRARRWLREHAGELNRYVGD